MLILAVDPGSAKSGLALVDGAGALLEQRVVPDDSVASAVKEVPGDRRPDVVVLGAGTTSARMRGLLTQLFPGLAIDEVDEAGSTLEARRLWLRTVPPRGLSRLLPGALRCALQAGELDGYAAWVLARRWLGARGGL